MVTITRLGQSGELQNPCNNANHFTINHNQRSKKDSSYSLFSESEQLLSMAPTSTTLDRNLKKVFRRLRQITKRILRRSRKSNFRIRTKSLTTPDGFKMHIFFLIDQGKDGIITELSYRTRGGKIVDASTLFGKDDTVYNFTGRDAGTAVDLFLDEIVELSRHIETEFVD